MHKFLTHNRYYEIGAMVWAVGVLIVYENLGYAAGTMAKVLYLIVVPLVIGFSARRSTSLKPLTLLASVALLGLLAQVTKPVPLSQKVLVEAGLKVITTEGRQ